MEKKKSSLTTGKKYSVGIACATVLYCVIRCLFSWDVNVDGVQSVAPQPVDCIFYTCFGVVTAICLIIITLVCEKRQNTLIQTLVPLVLIASLGEDRLYSSASSDGSVIADCGIIFAVMLIHSTIVCCSGFNFSGLAAVIAVFLIDRQAAVTAYLPLCLISLPAIYSGDEKKKKAGMLSFAVQAFLAIVLAVVGLINGEYGFTAPSVYEIVNAVIFCAGWCGVFIFALVKSGSIKDRIYCGLLAAIPVFTPGIAALLSAAVPPQQAVISSVAFSVLCLFSLLSVNEKGTPAIIAEKLSQNRVLYLLILIFIIRASAFLFVSFDKIIFS